MMYKLTENLQAVKRFFDVPQISFVLDSMIEGHTPCSIYVNDLKSPTVALIWDHRHVFYFGGETDDVAECQKAVAVLKEHLLDDETKKRLGIGKFNYTSDAWEVILLADLAEFKPGAYWRYLFRHNLEQIPKVNPAKAQIILREIDRTLLEDSTVSNCDAMVGEIRGMWGDPEKFLEYGFGSCALLEKTILCWCTGEYVSKDFCGIGIETVEEYTTKGIATVTAAYYLQQCVNNHKIPYWDSWKNNIGSVRVAEKVGFEKVTEYKMIFAKYDTSS